MPSRAPGTSPATLDGDPHWDMAVDTAETQFAAATTTDVDAGQGRS
jgi:hypothetical protein